MNSEKVEARERRKGKSSETMAKESYFLQKSAECETRIIALRLSARVR